MTNRLNNPAVVLASGLLFLTACSGGGGGGAATTATTSTPAPAAPIANNNNLVSLQTPDSTVTYQAASATALVNSAGTGGILNAASGQGATVTLTTAANGNLIKIAFSIPTGGGTFTQQFTGSAFDIPIFTVGVVSAAQLVTILRDVYGFPNTIGYSLTKSAGTQELTSTAYGLWASGDTATTGRAGTFAIGNLTPTTSVPATGSATFSGSTMGVGGANSGNTVYALEGKAQIIASFSAQSVTTNLTNLATQNILTNAVSSLPDLTGTSTMRGNAYAGPIAGTGLSGTINGNFYGPAAQETAGVWQASGGGNSWIGSYGAK